MSMPPEIGSDSKTDSGAPGANRSFWNDARETQLQLAIYIASASATVYGLWKLLSQKDEAFGPANWQFWVALTVAVLPVLVHLFTSILPNWREGRRERRLRLWSVEGTSGRSGYFRLTPYGGTEEDQKAFNREDQAHVRVLTWLRETTERLLYLTGVSGSGKSSVLAAHVVPNLGGDTLVVPLRASDDPIGQLREALLAPNAVWTAETSDTHRDDGDEDLLRNAAAWLHKRKFGLLLVLDQFEEFLVLHTGCLRPAPPLIDLLRAVAAGRCGTTRALTCLRIELIDELTRAGLPPCTERNHFTVPAFTGDAAKQFLSAGFDRVGHQLLERVVAEAVALDNLVGYVRPITLNMAGQMLRRMPTGTTRVQLGTRPFATYVSSLLKEDDVRGHATRILQQLIDDQNRRSHKTVRELAGSAGDAHLINGCLTRLALPERGLVRCLNPSEADAGARRWEVSHDFVATILATVLPAFQPGRWKKTRPWLGPIALVIWGGTFLFFLPYESRREQERQRNATVARLSTDFGVRIAKVENDGSLAIRLDPDHNLTSLAEVVPLLNAIGDVTSLDGSQHYHLNNLDRCAELRHLRTLNLSGCPNLVNVEGLKGMAALEQLNLSQCSSLRNVAGLNGLTALQRLNLNQCSNLTNVDGLNGLSALRDIRLLKCTKLASVDGLRGLPTLQTLIMSDCESLVSVDGLRELSALENLYLFNCPRLRSVDTLSSLPAIQELHLGECAELANVDALSRLTTLKKLSLRGCPRLRNVDALGGLVTLQELHLSKCEELASVDGLKRLTTLKQLSLEECNSIKENQIAELRVQLKGTKIDR